MSEHRTCRSARKAPRAARARGTSSLLSVALLGILAAAASTSPAEADVPGQVSFQGLLLDATGQPMTGTANLTFSLFAASSGGSALWSEAHPATAVTNGVYDVTLGETTPLTSALLAGTTRWLEVVVNGETLTPRRQLLAVPYAVTAGSLASLDALSGVPCKAQVPEAGNTVVTFSPTGAVSLSCSGLFTLTVNLTGVGPSPAPPIVTSNPTGITCNVFTQTDCTEAYLGGTVVTLTAPNNAAYQFTGWSGACSGAGPCTVTMTAARSVTANYSGL